MSDGAPDEGNDETPEAAASPDEEYAQAYSEGYGEGLREALRELLQHASRGHTAQELRYLVESRIARIKEDVELKRRSLLAPPRRPAWGSLLRVPGTPPATTAAADASSPEFKPGGTYLWWEHRPQKAVRFVVRHAERFPRLIWISTRPPEVAGLPTSRLVLLRPAPGQSPGGSHEGALAPGAIAGQVRDAVAAPGGALVYAEALEFMVTEYGLDGTQRFVNFVASQVTGSPSILVASADERALPPTERSRLEHAFSVVG